MRIGIGISVPGDNRLYQGNFVPTQISGNVLWTREQVTIATGVSQWTDLSGAGHHILQATGTKQPVFSASGGSNSKPMLSWDGVDDTMKATFALSQPVHIWLVAKYNAAFAANDDLADGNTGNTARFYRQSNVRMDLVGDGAGVKDISNSTYTTTSWHYHEIQLNGASSATFQDGVAKISGDAGNASPGGITLGTFGDGASDPANCSMSEVIVYNRILTAGEVARISSYLKSRYAL